LYPLNQIEKLGPRNVNINIKTFIIIVVILVIINIVGYLTRPAKYRSQWSQEPPAIAFVDVQSVRADV
jgi:hypothetical protein